MGRDRESHQRDLFENLEAGNCPSWKLCIQVMTQAQATTHGHNPFDLTKVWPKELEALKRKEAELRRALVAAEHPELADAIRLLQGRTYALERSQAKLLLGLSKAELRRRETLQKKRSSVEAKRAELDAQIAELDGELLGLGVERQQGFEAEHRQGLEELLLALGAHLGQVQAAGLEVTELVPDLKRWLPEIEQLAAQKPAN